MSLPANSDPTLNQPGSSQESVPTRTGRCCGLVVKLTLLFVLLSLADLLLTWKLISSGGGVVFESNPIANWWLTNYGWGGMTAFKLGSVLVVGSLCGILARSRPRTGELLLVFGCGAQVVVLLYSLFLARYFLVHPETPLGAWLGLENTSPQTDPAEPSSRVYVPASLPDSPTLVLLGQKSVQEELRLAEAQVQSITELINKRRGIRWQLPRMSQEAREAGIKELAEQEKKLVSDLQPKQTERLKQLALQQRGAAAFADPEVGAALQLTGEQKETISTIIEEARKTRSQAPAWRPPSDAGPRADAYATTEKVLALLSTEQKAKWKELTGEPFKFESPFGFGSRFGPGPRPPGR